MTVDYDALHDQAKYRLTISAQREQLKIGLKAKLLWAVKGGLFVVSPELIVLTKTYVDLGYTSVPIMDKNENPILIESIKSFHDNLVKTYVGVMNEYYKEYEKLSRARTTRLVVELPKEAISKEENSAVPA